MVKPGDVITMVFPGAFETKRRPAVVVSSDLYHAQRPDLIVGAISSQVAKARAQSDCELLDWSAAGLHKPSVFRTFLVMARPKEVHVIGHLSDRDWQAVKDCLQKALG
jgi:mRNA interferase MazF